MKKFASIAMALAGAVAIAWIIFSIIRFGAANMRRVEMESISWRMSWADRLNR